MLHNINIRTVNFSALIPFKNTQYVYLIRILIVDGPMSPPSGTNEEKDVYLFTLNTFIWQFLLFLE